MGLLSSAFLQVVVATVLLGALKRAGIVSVHPTAIDDDNARKAFEHAVDLGEAIAEKGNTIIDSIRRR